MQQGVVAAIPGIPGLPDAEDFINAFFEALQKIFGGNAQEAIRNALQDLADNIPVLDLDGSAMDRYDGMFAIALACGFIGSALQLLRMVKLGTWESFFDVLKIVPVTFIVLSILPYVTSVAAGAIGEGQRDFVEFVLDRPLDENAFDFTLSGDFGFLSTIFGWVGGGLLNLESELMIALLPQTLLVLALAVGLRWFGFMGDGLFVLCVGITITVLVGSFAMIFVLSLFFLAAQDSFDSGYIAAAVFVTAITPFVVFWLYFYFGINRRVSGLMELRQVNTAISARTRGDAASGGLAGKAALAAGGAMAGALYARANDISSRPEGVSRTEHARSQLHGRLNTAAATTIKTNPVVSAGLLMGAQFVKPRPKPPKFDNPDTT